MKTLNYFLAGALMMTACVEKLDTTAPEQNDSEKWEAEFGKVDPNQTWNMATKANLSISAKDAGLIEVFTQNPITEGSMLLMRKRVEAGTHDLQFDVPLGTDKVFVQVCNAVGPYVNGYLPLNGTTAVANAPATRTGDCPVTVNPNPLNVTVTNQNDWSKITTPFYILEGVEATKNETCWKLTDFSTLFFNDNSVFPEQKANIKANLGTDVVYTFAEAGPLELNLFYTGSDLTNKFGIIILDETGSREKSRKYIVADISPKDVYLWVPPYSDQWGHSKGNCENGASNCSNARHNGEYLPYTEAYGKTYKIPYVDANGETSYTFPKGTKVAFFNWATSGAETPKDNGHVNYSILDWNREVGFKSWITGDVFQGVATYKYGKETYIGFEDTGDMDMNDLVFTIHGKFEEEPEQLDPTAPKDPDPVKPTPAEKMTWTLAFEDQIGNKSDYDFNDVVIRVAYAAGETTADVTLCAAGGTLQSELFYGDESLGLVHDLFGDPKRELLINTNKIDKEYITKKLTVPADFSLSSDAPKFKIKVTYYNGALVSSLPDAASYGSTPHGFCVPGLWAWPREGMNISKAYPSFVEWTKDFKSNQEWYNNVNASAVVVVPEE